MNSEKLSSEQIYIAVTEILEMKKVNPDLSIADAELAFPVFCLSHPTLTQKLLDTTPENPFDLVMLRKMLGLRDKITPENYMDANMQMHQNLYKQYVQPKLSNSKLEQMIEGIIVDLVPIIQYVSQRRPQWERVNAPAKLASDLEEKFQEKMEKYKFIVAYILEKNLLDYDQIREYLQAFYMNDNEINIIQ
jgi:hypothetical protein